MKTRQLVKHVPDMASIAGHNGLIDSYGKPGIAVYGVGITVHFTYS